MTTPRICYFGPYKQQYPRNVILRRGLELNGASVVECHVSHYVPTAERARRLLKQFPTVADQCDTILLAEFSQSLAPVAWWLAKRHGKRLVIDAFTSLYDSAVGDRADVGRRSLAATRYWLMDWLAFRLADVLITDTAIHRDYFVETFGARAEKIHVVPVGAAREWFAATPTPPHNADDCLVLWYGTYIPLHGVETILRAAHLLHDESGIRFEMIGRGQTYAESRALADQLGLTNINFRDMIPPEDLPGVAARADIQLGTFGATDKAARVVPNKAYQALAMGKPLITAHTLGMASEFRARDHYYPVVTGHAEGLAAAIKSLAQDQRLGQAMGARGRSLMQAQFTEEAVAKRVLDGLASL